MEETKHLYACTLTVSVACQLDNGCSPFPAHGFPMSMAGQSVTPRYAWTRRLTREMQLPFVPQAGNVIDFAKKDAAVPDERTVVKSKYSVAKERFIIELEPMTVYSHGQGDELIKLWQTDRDFEAEAAPENIDPNPSFGQT